jgi:hypothetical protein
MLFGRYIIARIDPLRWLWCCVMDGDRASRNQLCGLLGAAVPPSIRGAMRRRRRVSASASIRAFCEQVRSRTPSTGWRRRWECRILKRPIVTRRVRPKGPRAPAAPDGQRMPADRGDRVKRPADNEGENGAAAIGTAPEDAAVGRAKPILTFFALVSDSARCIWRFASQSLGRPGGLFGGPQPVPSQFSLCLLPLAYLKNAYVFPRICKPASHRFYCAALRLLVRRLNGKKRYDRFMPAE